MLTKKAFLLLTIGALFLSSCHELENKPGKVLLGNGQTIDCPSGVNFTNNLNQIDCYQNPGQHDSPLTIPWNTIAELTVYNKALRQ